MPDLEAFDETDMFLVTREISQRFAILSQIAMVPSMLLRKAAEQTGLSRHITGRKVLELTKCQYYKVWILREKYRVFRNYGKRVYWSASVD